MGLFAFPAVVVSSFLLVSTIEVHFLVSCSPPNLSVPYTVKALGKESESQCEFPLYLGLPGLLYFYASPHLAFNSLFSKFYLMSYVFIWPLFLPPMLYHNWDRLYIVFLLRFRVAPSCILGFLVAVFFQALVFSRKIMSLWFI